MRKRPRNNNNKSKGKSLMDTCYNAINCFTYLFNCHLCVLFKHCVQYWLTSVFLRVKSLQLMLFLFFVQQRWFLLLLPTILQLKAVANCIGWIAILEHRPLIALEQTLLQTMNLNCHWVTLHDGSQRWTWTLVIKKRKIMLVMLNNTDSLCSFFHEQYYFLYGN